MKAIFNRNSMLCGWYERQNKNIFDKNMVWIGFVNNNNMFTRNGEWLGGFVNGTFVDKMGKPVAWIEGFNPMGCNRLLQPLTPLLPLTPLTPLRPLTPLTPLRPLVPLGGWSAMDWNEYINQ